MRSSYLILPYGNVGAKPMNPSVKKWIKWMRIFQLVLRCFEVLCAIGLLVFLILLRGMDSVTGWIMRIVVGYLHIINFPLRQILTFYSPALRYFTLFMVYTIWDENQMEEPQQLQRHICYLPHSSTYLSYHFMLSRLW